MEQNNNISFVDYAFNWINCSDDSIRKKRDNRTIIKHQIMPILKDTKVQNVSMQLIDEAFSNYTTVMKDLNGQGVVVKLLDSIFKSLLKDGLVKENLIDQIKNPILTCAEVNIIRKQRQIEIKENSFFCEASFVWLLSRNYKKVTYDLYFHFLKDYINPFIGTKHINEIKTWDITPLYNYFNIVSTNKIWMKQITRVLRMVFDYIIKLGLLTEDPSLKINEPVYKPLKIINKEDKAKVRDVIASYGFRTDKRNETVEKLFHIFKKEKTTDKNGVTFKDVYLEWLNNTQGVLRNESTYSKQIVIKNYALPCFGDIPIKALTKQDVEYALRVQTLLGIRRNDNLLTSITQILEYGYANNYIDRNVANNVKAFNRPKQTREILNDKEIVSFLKVCLKAKDGLMFAIMLLLGLRSGEIKGLKITNYNRDEKTVLIDSEVINQKMIFRTKAGKSRKILLSKAAIFFIEKAIEEKQKKINKMVNYYSNEDVFFLDDFGHLFSSKQMMSSLKNIMRIIGRPNLDAYSLRHSFMTVAVRFGDDLYSVQGCVGHERKSRVITAYLHDNKESRLLAAEKKQIYLEGLMEKYESKPHFEQKQNIN